MTFSLASGSKYQREEGEICHGEDGHTLSEKSEADEELVCHRALFSAWPVIPFPVFDIHVVKPRKHREA